MRKLQVYFHAFTGEKDSEVAAILAAAELFGKGVELVVRPHGIVVEERQSLHPCPVCR